MNLPTVFSGVHIARSLVFCVVFCRSLFVLLPFFFLAIVLSVLLRITASDYPFVVFKLFFLPRIELKCSRDVKLQSNNQTKHYLFKY